MISFEQIDKYVGTNHMKIKAFALVIAVIFLLLTFKFMNQENLLQSIGFTEIIIVAFVLLLYIVNLAHLKCKYVYDETHLDKKREREFDIDKNMLPVYPLFVTVTISLFAMLIVVSEARDKSRSDNSVYQFQEIHKEISYLEKQIQQLEKKRANSSTLK